MALSELLAGLKAEAAAEEAQLEAETRAEATRIRAAAEAEARTLHEERASSGRGRASPGD